MALDDLVHALPAYADDLGRNLRTVVGGSPLPPQRLWGTVLACAIAARGRRVLTELEPQARAVLSPRAHTAAKTAAAVMTMNNVFHRTRHLLSDDTYSTLRAGLRTNVIRDPGVDRTDYEFWCFAVSAVAGCGRCLDAHEHTLRTAGLDHETIQEAYRIAAVLVATAVTLEAEEAMGGA